VLGILSALEIEGSLIRANIINPADTAYAKAIFTSGVLADTPAVVVNTGVGKVNAAIATQLLIDHYNVDNLVLLGLGGGTGPDVNRGDIVISRDVIHHDIDATGFAKVKIGEIPFLHPRVRFFKAGKQLVQIARAASRSAVKKVNLPSNESGRVYHPRIIIGRVMTGDQFICDIEKVNWLRETFKGHCVEMEGAAVAQCAYLNNRPFVIIRAISDKCDEGAAQSFTEYLLSEAPKLLADVAFRMAEMLIKL
jgi:adenosylhomocysteine nucleosidase